MYIHPREWTPEINYISGGPFYKRAKRRLIQLFSYSVTVLYSSVTSRIFIFVLNRVLTPSCFLIIVLVL